MKKIISKILLATMALGLMAPSFAGAASLADFSVALSTHTISAGSIATVGFTAPTALVADVTNDVNIDFNGFEFLVTTLPDKAIFLLLSSLTVDGNDVPLEDIVDIASCDVPVDPDSAMACADSGDGQLLFRLGENIAYDADTVIEAVVAKLTNPGAESSYTVTGSVDVASTPVDSGSASVAIVDDSSIAVSAEVVPFITMAISDVDMTLDGITSSNTVTDTTTFEIDTNADDGYVVYADSGDLTHVNGTDTIDAYTGGSASSAGTEGFGFNTQDNSTPNVGSAATGTGASATSGGAVNQFTAQDNSTVASATDASADHVYTLSAVANASALTKAGSYTGTIELRTVATF